MAESKLDKITMSVVPIYIEKWNREQGKLEIHEAWAVGINGRVLIKHDSGAANWSYHRHEIEDEIAYIGKDLPE